MVRDGSDAGQMPPWTTKAVFVTIKSCQFIYRTAIASLNKIFNTFKHQNNLMVDGSDEDIFVFVHITTVTWHFWINLTYLRKQNHNSFKQARNNHRCHQILTKYTPIKNPLREWRDTLTSLFFSTVPKVPDSLGAFFCKRLSLYY